MGTPMSVACSARAACLRRLCQPGSSVNFGSAFYCETSRPGIFCTTTTEGAPPDVLTGWGYENVINATSRKQLRQGFKTRPRLRRCVPTGICCDSNTLWHTPPRLTLTRPAGARVSRGQTPRHARAPAGRRNEEETRLVTAFAACFISRIIVNFTFSLLPQSICRYLSGF